MNAVAPVLNAAQELREIRGPVGVPPQVGWAGLLIAIALLAAAGVYFWLRRRPAAATPPPIPRLPAWQTALEAIARLERDDYIRQGRVKEFYSGLSGIIRGYIEERFELRAPEMTTEEFMDAARRSERLTPVQKDFLSSFLNASDMVKFARFQPDPSDMRRALDLARAFVEEAR